MKRHAPSFVPPCLAAFLVAAVPSTCFAVEEPVPYHQLAPAPPLLALTPGLVAQDLAETLDRIEAAGFRTALAVSGSGIVVRDAPGAEAFLRGDPAVAEVLRSPRADPARSDPRVSDGLMKWWNDGFVTPRARVAGSERTLTQPMCAGAKTFEEGLLERQPSSPLRCYPSQINRVHFAAGRVICNLILPESTGPGQDWTAAEIASVEAEVCRALMWWKLKARHPETGREMLFPVLVNHGPVATQYEAAQVSVVEDWRYIGDTMDALGAPGGGCPYGRLDLFNLESRDAMFADWAFTQYVLDADQFANLNALAYAFLGGPYTVALRGNGSLTPGELDRVVAHEMGHIFQALDEYCFSGGACPCDCNQQAGYLWAYNYNCDKPHCPLDEKCVMRGGSEYDQFDSDHMEENIDACVHTRRATGIWDDPHDEDLIYEVMETRPETKLFTAVPDTILGSANYLIEGHAWDQPFVAPPQYVYGGATINTIRHVMYTVTGHPPRNAAAADGYFTQKEENFEIRLPELGGGTHRLRVWAVNSVDFKDPSAEERYFFVYDVKIKDELEVLREGSDFAISWKIDGEDFGSSYSLYRARAGQPEEEQIVARLASRGGRNDRFLHRDRSVIAGSDYVYRLEVDIPGKGRKTLGIARQTATLAEQPGGSFVTIAPNPFRDEVLFAVTVPRGPRSGQSDIPLDIADEIGSDTGGSSDQNVWRDIEVTLYDVRGRLVRDFGIVRQRERSRFNLFWDGLDEAGALSPPGVYFLRLELGYDERVEKIVRIR